MMDARSPIATVSRHNRGSIALLVLFVCLAMALVVQGLSGVIICAERESLDEAAGRERLAEKDLALTSLRDRALLEWQAAPWEAADSEQPALEGELTAIPGSDWALGAAVRDDSADSGGPVSAWIERGRDGLDLPLAAVVAARMDEPPARSLPWSGVDSADGSGGDPPVRLGTAWKLDPGWIAFAGAAAAPGLAAAAGGSVVVLEGKQGQTVSLPKAASKPAGAGGAESDGPAAGSSAVSPLLVLVTGGAGLDASGLGDVYAVIVVDGGPVAIDGTTVHGSVFATGDLDVGATGSVLFSRAVLRWATDRSLRRARLVPGTRWEGTE